MLGVCLIAEVVCLLIFDVFDDGRAGGTDGIPMEALNPFEILGNSDAAARPRRARRCGVLRCVLVVGRVRDGAQLRRGVAQPEEDDGVRDVHLGDRSRHPLHAHLLGLRRRLGRRALVGGDRTAVRAGGLPAAAGRVRVGLLSAHGRVRRARADDLLPAADDHRLVRVPSARSSTPRTGTGSRWAARRSSRQRSAGRTRRTAARTSRRSSPARSWPPGCSASTSTTRARSAPS